LTTKRPIAGARESIYKIWGRRRVARGKTKAGAAKVGKHAEVNERGVLKSWKQHEEFARC